MRRPEAASGWDLVTVIRLEIDGLPPSKSGRSMLGAKFK
jgi:hypothetical protein